MKNPQKKSTIRDFQIKLTLSQFERLKGRTIRESDLSSVLPKAKYTTIRPYLKDPDYFIDLVRPFRGNGALIGIRLNRVDEVIFMPKKIASLLEKACRDGEITPNQFINLALREKLNGLEGK